jgi:hypothetical protein
VFDTIEETRLKHLTRTAAVALCTTAALTAAHADTFSGRLNDPGNAALRGSDLGAPNFANDAAIANNVALYEFTVTTEGTATIASTGFAAGGVDPYVSLFMGQGGGAGWIASNYDQAFGTGGDFIFSALLSPGVYTVAVGAFANMSFAENIGIGTLADTFTGLGTASALGNASYRIEVTTPVPEPSIAWLLAAGLLTLNRRAGSARQRSTGGDCATASRP